MICSLCVAVFMLFTFTIFTFSRVSFLLRLCLSLYQIICKCVKYIPKNLHFAPCKSTFSTLILPFAGAVKVPTEAHFSAPRANFY